LPQLVNPVAPACRATCAAGCAGGEDGALRDGDAGLAEHAARSGAASSAAAVIFFMLPIVPPIAPHVHYDQEGSALIINYDGGQYPFDMDDVTVKQALKIEKFMGCPFAEWGKKLTAGGDMRARQVLGWLILHPDGGTAIEDTDFKLLALGQALDEAIEAEEAGAPEAEPVPTVATSNGHSPPGESSLVSLPPSSDEISR
jgi:hypothetical protein